MEYVNQKKHYYSLDGLRGFAAILILMMHIKANSLYEPTGRVMDVISQCGQLVLLFMIISSFSVCCGYYEKFKNQQINIANYYKKRYMKIWPFFALLVCIDIILQHDIGALYEAFADLTLCFSLLPNPTIEVIGVGWFLGVVFLFYMLFPFFCFLLENKKRAWFVFVISVLYHFVCGEYFFDADHVTSDFGNGHNFLWYAMYFVLGGIIYLYRNHLEQLVRKAEWLWLLLSVLLTLGWCMAKPLWEGYYSDFSLLILFAVWIIYAIGTEHKWLVNPITKFLSGISMEIYLCHMVIFRVVEKLGLLYILGNGWIGYLVTCVVVLFGAIAFSLVVKKVIFPAINKGISGIRGYR